MINFIRRVNEWLSNSKYPKFFFIIAFSIYLIVYFFLNDEYITWISHGIDENNLIALSLGIVFIASFYFGWFFIYYYLISSFFLIIYDVYREANSLVNLQLVASILLIAGAFPIEAMWYYTFLRIVVFIIALGTIFSNYAKSKDDDFALGAVILFTVIAVLFNPLFPIYFWSKTPWIWIDVLSALFFFTAAAESSKKLKELIK